MLPTLVPSGSRISAKLRWRKQDFSVPSAFTGTSTPSMIRPGGLTNESGKDSATARFCQPNLDLEHRPAAPSACVGTRVRKCKSSLVALNMTGLKTWLQGRDSTRPASSAILLKKNNIFSEAYWPDDILVFSMHVSPAVTRNDLGDGQRAGCSLLNRGSRRRQ
jgi:hypothetical protein